MRYSKLTSTGFTLIELLISLVIGTIVIGTGFSLYLQTSATRTLIQAELALQENTYYIDYALRQLISQAGHRPLVTSLLTTPLLPVKLQSQAFSESIGSSSTDSASGNWLAGQYLRAEDDGISLRYIGASDDTGAADGTLIDCQGTPVAEDESVVIALTVVDKELLCTVDGGSVALVANVDGVSIESIVVSWGIDLNNDNSVDEYRSAADEIDSDETILLVRLSMLLSSNDTVSFGDLNYTFNGVDYTSPDSKLRRESVTTVQIAN